MTAPLTFSPDAGDDSEELARAELYGLLARLWLAPPDSALLRLPNVTLTPHIAGASLQTVKVAAAKIAEELRRHVAGEPFLNPC